MPTKDYLLTNLDMDVVLGKGLARDWCSIWQWQIPIGTEIILPPDVRLLMSLKDSTSADQFHKICYVRIEHYKVNRRSRELIYGPVSYRMLKINSPFLHLAKSYYIYPKEWLVISVLSDNIIDVSASCFDLHVLRFQKD